MKVTQALLSVSDKRGAVDFARGLAQLGIRLLSTGGTAKLLRDAGLAVTDVSDYTGFPEMLDGRVKTLHPKVHGGILGRRDLAEHVAVMARHDIPAIDLVVVNLYPFRETVAKPGCTLDDAIENIDIGGPAMVRAAAKNHGNEQGGVAVLTDPEDYAPILEELKTGGAISYGTRFALAKKAFTHTARYDSAIANWLTSLDEQNKPGPFPEKLQLAFDKVETLRYGENPHQQAAFYRETSVVPGCIASYQQIQGKELSYNNIADADAAWECVKAFDASIAPAACVIVKHANPCGVAEGSDLVSAYRKALACDSTSAFGGIVAVNCVLDADAARAITEIFTEVIIAPDATEEAIAVVSAKKNLRLLLAGGLPNPRSVGLTAKTVAGGLLVQSRDNAVIDDMNLKVVTRRAPTDAELRDLRFAFRVAKHVKSNTIIYARDLATVGIGAGQMSRVDSARIAARKALDAAAELKLAEPLTKGSVVASDAFFPFADGMLACIEAGATAVIQPGGSVRDDEVIKAADEHGIAMVFTGVRHFRH